MRAVVTASKHAAGRVTARGRLDHVGDIEYLVLLGVCLLVTLPLELALGVGVYRQVRRLLASLACVAATFVAWDLVGARLGHWDYNPAYLSGVRLLELPLEEYLFFVVVPLCGILAYEAVRKTLPRVRGRLGGSAREGHRRG
jgi:lycopene beta-cyclase